MSNPKPLAKTKFSKTRQPSKEARVNQGKKCRYTKELEYQLLQELFKPDITMEDENGKKIKVSSMVACINRLKKTMVYSDKDKVAFAIFFKFMERIFGKPVETVEASVETEVRNYSREEVIKMILDARTDKTINVGKKDVDESLIEEH
jgi:hypothetical protein